MFIKQVNETHARWIIDFVRRVLEDVDPALKKSWYVPALADGMGFHSTAQSRKTNIKVILFSLAQLSSLMFNTAQ